MSSPQSLILLACLPAILSTSAQAQTPDTGVNLLEKSWIVKKTDGLPKKAFEQDASNMVFEAVPSAKGLLATLEEPLDFRNRKLGAKVHFQKIEGQKWARIGFLFDKFVDADGQPLQIAIFPNAQSIRIGEKSFPLGKTAGQLEFGIEIVFEGETVQVVVEGEHRAAGKAFPQADQQLLALSVARAFVQIPTLSLKD